MAEEKVKQPKVIYEDEVMLAVDKPAGMIVNRVKTAKNQLTLEDWAAKRLRQNRKKKVRLERSGIVHRLDKETSGVVVIAKSREAMKELQRQFKKRLTKKTYLALVHGRMEKKEGEIRAPVSRNPFNRRKFGVFVAGREAETKFSLKEERENDKGEKFSLLEVRPKTGRTHQIRVHLKHLGHPIVADELYVGRKTARKDRQWCPRLWLHASRLEVFHPITGSKLSLSAELAADLKTVLKRLKKA